MYNSTHKEVSDTTSRSWFISFTMWVLRPQPWQQAYSSTDPSHQPQEAASKNHCVHPERQTKHRLFSKFSKLATELSYEKQQPWLKETAFSVRVPFICVEKADQSFWCLRQLCREFVCPYLSKYLLTLCTAVQIHVQVAQLSLLFLKDLFLLFYLYKCLLHLHVYTLCMPGTFESRGGGVIYLVVSTENWRAASTVDHRAISPAPIYCS